MHPHIRLRPPEMGIDDLIGEMLGLQPDPFLILLRAQGNLVDGSRDLDARERDPQSLVRLLGNEESASSASQSSTSRSRLLNDVFMLMPLSIGLKVGIRVSLA
jgi:hypothetical protein